MEKWLQITSPCRIFSCFSSETSTDFAGFNAKSAQKQAKNSKNTAVICRKMNFASK
jgi:hypothetical protein